MRREGVIWAGLGVLSGMGMAVAAYLLMAPNLDASPAIMFQDKIFHILGFACLTGPGVLVLPRRYLWFWLAHMTALGVGVEIVQAMAGEGRSDDVSDFIADCIGIVAATGLGRQLRERFERRARVRATGLRLRRK